MRVFSLAALVLLPALSFAQAEEAPPAPAEPAAEATAEAPGVDPSTEAGEAKEGRGHRWKRRHHHGHSGEGASARGWHAYRGAGWRMAVEAGTGLGLGLSAQVSVRPRRGPFAIGVGAVGFGERRLDWGPDDRDGEGAGDGRRRSRVQAAARQGYFLSLQRYRSSGRSGLYAGLKLGVADASFRRGGDDPARMWAFFASPELGVQWFPFRRSFFIRPSVGANLFAGRWAGDAQAPVPPFLTGWGALSVGLAR